MSIEIDVELEGVERTFAQGGNSYKLVMSKANALALQSSIHQALVQADEGYDMQELRTKFLEAEGYYGSDEQVIFWNNQQ